MLTGVLDALARVALAAAIALETGNHHLVVARAACLISVKLQLAEKVFVVLSVKVHFAQVLLEDAHGGHVADSACVATSGDVRHQVCLSANVHGALQGPPVARHVHGLEV